MHRDYVHPVARDLAVGLCTQDALHLSVDIPTMKSPICRYAQVHASKKVANHEAIIEIACHVLALGSV
jgi:hypothetical protein